MRGLKKKFVEIREISRPRRFPPVKPLYNHEKRFSDPVKTNYYHSFKIIVPDGSYPPDDLDTARKYVLLYIATAGGYLTIRLSYSDLKELSEFLVSVASDPALLSALKEQKLIPVPAEFFIRRKSAGSSISAENRDNISAENRENQSIDRATNR